MNVYVYSKKLPVLLFNKFLFFKLVSFLNILYSILLSK